MNIEDLKKARKIRILDNTSAEWLILRMMRRLSGDALKPRAVAVVERGDGSIDHVYFREENAPGGKTCNVIAEIDNKEIPVTATGQTVYNE